MGYFTKSGIRDRLFVVAARNGTFYGRPMLAGHKYALAGAGPAGDSGDGEPALRADIAIGPVAIDHHGNVLLGERGTVRVVATSAGNFYGTAMTAGDIYTVGSDRCGSGPVGPWQLAIDAAGNIIMSEPLFPFDRVRVFAATSETFYGVPMVAGHIYTIGGTAIPASPTALAVTGSGDVLVGDALRVYSIAG